MFGGLPISRVFSALAPIESPILVGATVSIRGTAAAAFNRELRQIVTVTLFAPQANDVIIQQPAPSNPFDGPLVLLNSIAQYRREPPPGYQVHVKGVVTYQSKGSEGLFLQDATGGLQIKSTSTNIVSPGDQVEVVGFPAVENYLPVLEDAVFRKTTEPRAKMLPRDVPIGELLQGLHHADFITLTGKLLDRLAEEVPSPAGKSNIVKTTLVLQTTNLLFTAEAETLKPDPVLASIPPAAPFGSAAFVFFKAKRVARSNLFKSCFRARTTSPSLPGRVG